MCLYGLSLPWQTCWKAPKLDHLSLGYKLARLDTGFLFLFFWSTLPLSLYTASNKWNTSSGSKSPTEKALLLVTSKWKAKTLSNSCFFPLWEDGFQALLAWAEELFSTLFFWVLVCLLKCLQPRECTWLFSQHLQAQFNTHWTIWLCTTTVYGPVYGASLEPSVGWKSWTVWCRNWTVKVP